MAAHHTDISGLYIHVPFCRSKCPYCSFHSTTSLNRIDTFLAGLFAEMNFYGPSSGLFDTLYIGGGTPSVLTCRQIGLIVTQARNVFKFKENPEITAEINPADMSFSDLQSLRRTGVNRISIGVQSFDDKTLQFLGRRHTGHQARRTVEDAGRAGFENVGLDLMYGIPGQDVPSWLKTLEEAVSYQPEHFSCYQLTVEDDTPLGKRCRAGEFVLPDDDEQYEFFVKTSAMLTGAGYIHYEVSNFARSDTLVSGHNSKYWNHSPYLGLGPAAHSFSENRRWWNKSNLAEYLADIGAGRPPVARSETLSSGELRLEALFLGFRTKEGIHLEDFNARFSCDLLYEKSDVIGKLLDSGLLRIDGGYLRPTSSGLALADSLSLI
jgi:oxygen-independent coproporphyrinogen-3 oxidase